MSESWDTVTAYGNVDMTLHPVLRRAYRVACLIERCGASPELTAASSAAFDLCGEIAETIEALQARVGDRRRIWNEAREHFDLQHRQVMAQFTAAMEGVTALAAENDALRARAEAAEKDAARYRYLRTPTDVTKRPEPLQVMHWLDTGPAHCEGEQLDRCVDAAIAAGGDDAKD